MLADPALAEAELVGPAQGLEVPSMTIEKAALRRMRRHRKQAVLHQDLAAAGFGENSLSGASGQPRIWRDDKSARSLRSRLICVNFRRCVSKYDTERPKSAFFLPQVGWNVAPTSTPAAVPHGQLGPQTEPDREGQQ